MAIITTSSGYALVKNKKWASSSSWTPRCRNKKEISLSRSGRRESQISGFENEKNLLRVGSSIKINKSHWTYTPLNRGKE